VNLGLAERFTDIGIKLVEVVSCRLVVADGEDRCNIRADVAKTLRTIAPASAVNGSTANKGCGLPDDLSEVTISVKGGLVVDVGWSSFAVETGEVRGLGVIEEFSDDGCYIVSRAASSNVLAKSSTVGSGVVGIVARIGDLESRRSGGVIPSKIGSRVVGAVSVMMGNNQSSISASCCDRSRGSSS